MTQMLDLRGMRFGALTPLRVAARTPVRWFVRCDCGTEKVVRGAELLSGKTLSCGCRRRAACAELGRRTAALNSRAGARAAAEKRTRHGRAARGSRDATYQTWEAMIARCENPRGPRWARYGGRGITVCTRWRHSFESFLADMGERPRGKTIDRIDNDGNYEPGNCRWATATEQAANTSRGGHV